MRPNTSFEPDRSPYRPIGPAPTQSSSSYYSGPFGWWLRLTAPPEPPASADFATRDRARRGRLGGALLFGLLAIMILAVFIGLGDPPTLISSLIGVGAVVVAIILNRSGFVNLAGLIMVALPALVIILSIVYAPNGLETIYLPLFDLLAISEVVAASLLTPSAVLLVMLALVGFTVGDILLQPHITDMNLLYASSDGLLTLIARPVGFLIIVGVIGFLWARNTVESIRRADRAEELAELERRELDRTRELEEGVRQLLAVHVHLANGDFNVRAPAIRNGLLWQIGSSLNNLVARLGRLAQADFTLRRTQEEANRITEAIYMLNSGRAPLWPAPSNTPLDRLVDVLRATLTPRAGVGGPSMPQLPPSAPGAFPGATPGMPASNPNSMMGMNGPSSAYPGASAGNNAMPDWMRSLMPGDGGGQPQQAPFDDPRDPRDPRGPMSGSASAYGAPVSPGYAPPPPPPQADVNPWSLESNEPLQDSDLPAWLRQPNQE